MTTLNERACRLLEFAAATSDAVEHEGIIVYDVGVEQEIEYPLEVGVRIAEASSGGLASVSVDDGSMEVVIKRRPALATLGCQLAGWKIEEGAYASGPGRILAKKPREFFQKVGYSEKSDRAALLVECERMPSFETLEYVRGLCGVSELACACFKSDSMTSVYNVLARVVEMAFFRLDYLGYDTRNVFSARGRVPCEGVSSVADANDAIIYRSEVWIQTRGWDEKLTEKSVSSASRFYGQSFADVLEIAGGDFFKIDFDFYAPAKLTVRDLDSGETHKAGEKRLT